MWQFTYLKLAIVFGVSKGLIISAFLFALGVTFWQQLVIAVVSSVIGMAGVILASVVVVAESRKTRRHVIDIKQKVGADQRENDLDIRADPNAPGASDRREHGSDRRNPDADVGPHPDPHLDWFPGGTDQPRDGDPGEQGQG